MFLLNLSISFEIPAESINIYCLPRKLTSFFLKSRVNPEKFLTRAIFFSTIALKREDFPTLGFPKIITSSIISLFICY